MKDLESIKGILPHRYPFLMIDRVLEVEAGTYCKALKNITANEEIFQALPSASCISWSPDD